MQGFCKKRKDTKSFGTLLGTFNTRYFTLDLGTLQFYYAKSDQAIKNFKHFQLEVKRVNFEFE